MKLKILTWNIWDVPFWFSVRRHERLHYLGKYLREQAADIICLQESFDVKHRDLILRDLGQEYFITEGFERSRRVFLFKRFDITGGLVIYSRFPILASSFVPFGRKLHSGLVERVGRKGFLQTVVKIGATPLLLVNTHLFSRSNLLAQKFRERQLTSILDKLERLRDHTLTMLLGDLNLDLEAEYRAEALLLRAGFKEAGTLVQERPDNLATLRLNNPHNHSWIKNNFDRVRKDRRLDFIFIRGQGEEFFSVKKLTVPAQPQDPPLSDHEPLLLELELGARI